MESVIKFLSNNENHNFENSCVDEDCIMTENYIKYNAKLFDFEANVKSLRKFLNALLTNGLFGNFKNISKINSFTLYKKSGSIYLDNYEGDLEKLKSKLSEVERMFISNKILSQILEAYYILNKNGFVVKLDSKSILYKINENGEYDFYLLVLDSIYKYKSIGRRKKCYCLSDLAIIISEFMFDNIKPSEIKETIIKNFNYTAFSCKMLCMLKNNNSKSYLLVYGEMLFVPKNPINDFLVFKKLLQEKNDARLKKNIKIVLDRISSSINQIIEAKNIDLDIPEYLKNTLQDF